MLTHNIYDALLYLRSQYRVTASQARTVKPKPKGALCNFGEEMQMENFNVYNIDVIIQCDI